MQTYATLYGNKDKLPCYQSLNHWKINFHMHNEITWAGYTSSIFGSCFECGRVRVQGREQGSCYE